MEDDITVSEHNDIAEILRRSSEADLYKGTQITRWSTRNYIKSENDCEHQNIVTQIVIIICEYFHVSLATYRNALGLASIHDMFEYAEGGMGDIPHHIKEKSPEIRKIVENHELETITSNKYFGNAYSAFFNDELARKIVNLADTIDVLLYIDREFKLGNQDPDFKEIRPKAFKRAIKYGYELISQIKESK